MLYCAYFATTVSRIAIIASKNEMKETANHKRRHSFSSFVILSSSVISMPPCQAHQRPLTCLLFSCSTASAISAIICLSAARFCSISCRSLGTWSSCKSNFRILSMSSCFMLLLSDRARSVNNEFGYLRFRPLWRIPPENRRCAKGCRDC